MRLLRLDHWNVTFTHAANSCIAIKSGRDWSGRMVNISTVNVLAEGNTFLQGHGVSIGSETSGYVRGIYLPPSPHPVQQHKDTTE